MFPCATTIVLITFAQSTCQAIVVTFSTKEFFLVLPLQLLHKAHNGLRETTKGTIVMHTRLHKGYTRLKCIIEQCCAKKNLAP